MHRLVHALLALNALLLACSPASDIRSPNDTTSPRTYSENATSGPSAAAAPNPTSYDPKNPVTPGFHPRAVAFIDADHGIIGGKIACPSPCTGRGGGSWR